MAAVIQNLTFKSSAALPLPTRMRPVTDLTGVMVSVLAGIEVLEATTSCFGVGAEEDIFRRKTRGI